MALQHFADSSLRKSNMRGGVFLSPAIVPTCFLPARLSQDLAKDLAILAREIHDVAGDGDPQNLGVDSDVPVSTVTSHDQVQQRLYHILVL